MAKEARQSKSETLTIRLDAKSRFILEFMSRAKGQTITTVVERAIIEAANNVSLNDGFTKWQDVWSVSEGVRAIRIARLSELYPTFEEEQLISFVNTHSDFFYSDKKSKTERSGIIDIIWPKIKDYLAEWVESKSSDYFGTGKRMAEAVRAAGLKPPVWPPENEPAKDARVKDVIDDDLPF